MKRSIIAGVLAAAALGAVWAAPALAHGEHDARPLARNLAAGPYRVSLWQVYPDAGDAMTPHLIVMVEGGTPTAVVVEVDGSAAMVHPSTTTANAWETMEGITAGDVLEVSLADGAGTFALDRVVVPPPTTFLPMQELIYASIVLTAGTAVWVARRTTRAWRRPVVSPADPVGLT